MTETLVVIPAYNEQETIEEVVRLTIRHSDVCVVDDGSKDSTPEILNKLKTEFGDRLHIIRHIKNTHIPGGIQDGMKLALEKDYKYTVTMDAGMSHDPDRLPDFFALKSFDLVIGQRAVTENVPIYRKLISWCAARVMNYCLSPSILNFWGPGIKDCTSGYRMYSKPAFERIAEHKLESIAFDFHMEALYLTYKNGGKVKELPIHYKFSNSSFNKKVFKQALAFAWKLFKKKF